MRWGVLAYLLIAAPASAESVLLLPLVAKGHVDVTTTHKIAHELERALEGRAQVTEDKAAHKCGPEAPCLAAAGRKAHADKVLHGRIGREGKTHVVHFMLVASESGTVLQSSNV